MSAIITADIHLTDKSRDEYRWGLFDWLLTQEADELLILGDLTDDKDRHSSILVNRVCRAVEKLEEKFRQIILKGNHDYIDPSHPFFRFLGSSSDITYIADPAVLDLSIGKATFVPAGAAWGTFKLHQTAYLFTHATFSGAKAENGTTLTGVDPAVLDGFEGKVYSGDIHVPQKKPVEYVGAPYHIDFGDNFEPRLVRIDNKGRASDLHYPDAPKKRVFDILHPDDLTEENARKGDYVKVRCHLRRADYTEWHSYKEMIAAICEKREWLLFGCESLPIETATVRDPETDAVVVQVLKPNDLVAGYAKRMKADEEHVKIGMDLLNAD